MLLVHIAERVKCDTVSEVNGIRYLVGIQIKRLSHKP